MLRCSEKIEERQVGDLGFVGPVGPRNSIQVLNTSFDSYAVRVDVSFLGETLDLLIHLGDPTGMIFSDDSLPLSPPNLATVFSTQFNIFDESEIIPLSLKGDIILAVPEPGTLSLLVLGALMIAKGRMP